MLTARRYMRSAPLWQPCSLFVPPDEGVWRTVSLVRVEAGKAVWEHYASLYCTDECWLSVVKEKGRA